MNIPEYDNNLRIEAMKQTQDYKEKNCANAIWTILKATKKPASYQQILFILSVALSPTKNFSLRWRRYYPWRDASLGRCSLSWEGSLSYHTLYMSVSSEGPVSFCRLYDKQGVLLMTNSNCDPHKNKKKIPGTWNSISDIRGYWQRPIYWSSSYM